jgi:hypothetical protein
MIAHHGRRHLSVNVKPISNKKMSVILMPIAGKFMSRPISITHFTRPTFILIRSRSLVVKNWFDDGPAGHGMPDLLLDNDFPTQPNATPVQISRNDY